MTEPRESTVLVVDDSAIDLAILTEILRADHRVIGMTEPEEALSLLRGSDLPDLVLLDIMLPGKTGLEISRQMKANPATADLPIIFVTSKDGDEDEAAGFAAGGVDYVTKPVNPTLLRARVRAHVELKRAREDLQRQNAVLRENARLREEVEHVTRHDLKNPLMVIMNASVLLREQANITTGQKRWLEMIDEAARRMLETINRSIDMIRMENLVYTLHAVSVDAAAVTRRIAAGLQAAANDRNVAFSFALSGSPLGPRDTFMVRAEEPLLHSMLMNLVRNAVEAAPPGSTVSVSFNDSDSAVIAVHNEGAIPQEIRGRFFEKFVTAGKKGGTGLGAYSARLIAQTLGGSLRFETSEETGTTIYVSLPRST